MQNLQFYLKPSFGILKAIYPNSTFQPDYLNISFDEAVNIQFGTAQRKQVEARNGLSWRSMYYDAYNWDNNTYYINNGGWVSASKSIIAYYLDPRNFLSADSVFMFMQQSYHPSQTSDMVRTAVAGTFLADGYDGNPDAYINDILKAASEHEVSPLVLAATIIVEQGTSGSSELVSGNSGYYNFFNIGASGTTTADVVASGLQKAKEKGWDTREKAIVGGAETYADGYISVGQDTFYYKNFNFVNSYPSLIYHQYAQSIFDSYNNGLRLKKGYSKIDNNSITLTFKIPVFKDMPTSPVTKPIEDNKQNNFYLTQMDVAGLSPSFNMFTQNYSLSVGGDTVIYVKVPEGASIASQESYQLVSGTNRCVITVKAQTGYTNDYIVSVNTLTPCTLTVTTNEQGWVPEQPNPPVEPDEPTPPEPPASTNKKGDVDGNGIIDVVDYTYMRLHILELEILPNDKILKFDTNGDGRIAIMDITAVRLHLLEIEFLN